MASNQSELQEGIEATYANINNLDSSRLASYKLELKTYQDKFGAPKWGGVDYSLYDSTSLGKAFDPTDATKTEGSGDQYSGGLPIWDPTLASGMAVGKALSDQQTINDIKKTGSATETDKANTDFYSHTNIDDNGQLKVDDAGNKTNTDDAVKKQKNKAWEMYAVGGAIALGVILIVASR